MKYHTKRIKFNPKRFTAFILITLSAIFILSVLVDVFCFPECYSPTLKYQLHNDIISGDKQAIEYYQQNYVDKGRILFEGVNE